MWVQVDGDNGTKIVHPRPIKTMTCPAVTRRVFYFVNISHTSGGILRNVGGTYARIVFR